MIMNFPKITLMVLAVILAVLFCTGSCTAADVYDREVNLDALGNYAPVFVYEKVVIKNADGTNATVLNKYGDGSNPSVINTIHAGLGDVFNILEVSLAGETGAYRVGNTDKYVMIYYPELIIKGHVLGARNDDNSPTGNSANLKNKKPVLKGDYLIFYYESPHVGPAAANSASNLSSNFTIYLTTPAGGKTSTFGEVKYQPGFATEGDLSEINISGSSSSLANPDTFRWCIVPDNAEYGLYEARAEFTKPASFKNYAAKSNTLTFIVTSNDAPTLVAKRDTVVRTNDFLVQLKGSGIDDMKNNNYFVYMQKRDLTNGFDYPTILPGLSNVKYNVNIPAGLTDEVGVGTIKGAYYYVTTNLGVTPTTRSIEFHTTGRTEPGLYTIKAVQLIGGKVTPASTKAQIKIRVEKGEVSISAASSEYYLGEEIRLFGNNTASSYTYLFLTGPNLEDPNGIVLKTLGSRTPAWKATQSDAVSVTTNATWEYKWDTSDIGLDAGAYTIYAASAATNGKSSEPKGDAIILADTEYGTLSLSLKQPGLSAIPSSAVIAKGDKLTIRGTAQGSPSAGLKISLFGPNKFLYESASVNDDGSYEKKIEIPRDWSSNQYFVVIQHPMYNGIFDAVYDGKDTFSTPNSGENTAQSSFNVLGPDKLQGSQAADALCKMINSPNIDDIYTKLTFTVAEPWIRITAPGSQPVGSIFSLSGTTNLAEGDHVLIEITSTEFSATDKTSTSPTAGFSKTIEVAKSLSDNIWSVEVDAANLRIDQYTIKVSGIEVDASSTAELSIIDKTAVHQPTAKQTSAVTSTPSSPATTPGQAQKSPGFGLIVVAGLLGAFLLVRKP